ncbi:hypothetical protein KM799_07305 [Clostridium tyrobutyricum]|uniref:hypothetical protein n=1 Tax=Clostridium tyrobutyricum TaxID=1519 RepID=UPI001C393561|nr:hypothetical protein [Clostridium tyrobutyricum]MBV4446409.1 hypothetical protein [Clostridium tyrobutyricum]
MAGYVFSIHDKDSLIYCINNGIYSTNLSTPSNNRWCTHHEGTFADYISMKQGDNVYFFIKRNIYGIGEMINIGHACRYKNYPESFQPITMKYDDIKDTMLINDDISNVNNRLICTFKHSPNFFENGVDMDDVLASNPNHFRMLRAFWKSSFIKIDDEENKALRDVILKRNEEAIGYDNQTFCFYNSQHNNMNRMINHRYDLSTEDILDNCHEGTYIKHEMAIETYIIDIISNRQNSIFGRWDYVSHQVIASPFKAIEYMDKMDVFGYKYIKGFNTISKYLVIELKKDTAKKDAIDQIMKYVDWINQEYAYGDYSMIQAFIVAYDFPQDVIDYRNSVCIRNYIRGRRPVNPDKWSYVKLIKYAYDEKSKNLILREIN